MVSPASVRLVLFASVTAPADLDLHLTGLTVAGTDLHLILTDASGRPLTANRVELRASMPGRDIAPVEVPLQAAPDGWSGRFQFPLQGVWKLILTVEDRNLTAVVTAGEVAIRT